MDRRSEPRIPCRQPAKVVNLHNTEQELEGNILNLSGRGVLLLLPEPLPVNTPVRIDARGIMFLGDICHLRETRSGWQAGVMLSHWVGDTGSLIALIDKLEDERLEAEDTATFSPQSRDD